MITFRDITDLEPIKSIPDNADIVVVVDGVAKRISKENAKFGGGAVEKKVFYIGEEQTSEQSANAENGIAVQGAEGGYTLYKDAECTTLATAQEVYDAWAEGSLIFGMTSKGLTEYFSWDTFFWGSGDDPLGDTTNVTFVKFYQSSTNITGTVGTSPIPN